MKDLQVASLVVSVLVLIVVPATAFYVRSIVQTLLREQQDRDQKYRDKINRHEQTLYGESGTNGMKLDTRKLKGRVHALSSAMNIVQSQVTAIQSQVDQLEVAFTTRRKYEDTRDPERRQ